MQIVEPKVELWNEQDVSKAEDHIARCARVCYASDKTTDNEKMVLNLAKRKHLSMFRHQSVYLKIPANKWMHAITINMLSQYCPYCNVLYSSVTKYFYVATNYQFYAESILSEYEDYRIDIVDAFNDEIFYKNDMLRYTFCIETGIDITRELNRVSPNNIAEQSTRYVDFLKKLGIRISKPHWWDSMSTFKKVIAWTMFKMSEINYKIAKNILKLPPQDARDFLVLKTNSKVAYTYSVKEWRHIIDLRYFGTTGKPHPDAVIVAEKIKELLEEEGYSFNNSSTGEQQ